MRNDLYSCFKEDISMNPNKDLKKIYLETSFNFNYSEFSKSINYNLGFFNQSFKSISLVELLKKNNDADYIFDKYNIYLKDKSFMPNYNEYMKLLNEKMYIDNYQSFEVFISNNYKYIFWFIPKLLSTCINNKAYKKYKQFKGNNILFLKKNLIDYNVARVLMKSNITISIKDYYKLINKEVDISQEELNKLHLIAINRNQVIHNLGIIDTSYIWKLEQLGFKAKGKEGDYLFDIDDKNKISINDDSIFLENIAKKIHDQSINWSKQQFLYSSQILLLLSKRLVLYL